MIITGKKFSKPALSRVINGDTELPAAEAARPKVRLDHLLVQQFPEYNRSTLQQFVKSGFVTVDQRIVKKANTLLDPEQKLELHLPPRDQQIIQPPVLYEDENVLVLNKPAGLLSMKKGEYSDEVTLEQFGLLVHRLDRDTSGVVILAKNPATQTLLRKQFQDRKVKKTYFAVVSGRPKLEQALIDLPIARNFKHPTTFQVDPNGKASQTYYRVLRSNGEFSLLELKPTTGRTHQLRVHLKYLGTPIVGDRVYHPELELLPLRAPQRLYLHAASLEITIPEGDRRVFQAPLPPEFERVF